MAANGFGSGSAMSAHVQGLAIKKARREARAAKPTKTQEFLSKEIPTTVETCHVRMDQMLNELKKLEAALAKCKKEKRAFIKALYAINEVVTDKVDDVGFLATESDNDEI